MQVGGNTFSALNFDVISFNNFVATTSDFQGRGLIRNNAQVGNGWSVGAGTHSMSTDLSLPYAMVVGGSFNWGSGAVLPSNEGLFVGSTFTGPSYLGEDVLGSCPSNAGGCLSSEFSGLQQCYANYQATFSAQTDNVAHLVQWSGLSITCNSPTASTYYMTLTPAELTQYTYISGVTGCNSAAQWIITISGTSDVTFTGASLPFAAGSTTVNVVGSGRTIFVHDTTLNANLFAPYNFLQQTSGLIVGRVVVGNILGSWQMNKAQCFVPQAAN